MDEITHEINRSRKEINMKDYFKCTDTVYKLKIDTENNNMIISQLRDGVVTSMSVSLMSIFNDVEEKYERNGTIPFSRKAEIGRD